MERNYSNLIISKLDLLLFKCSSFIFKKTKFNTHNIFFDERVRESRIASAFLSRKSTTMNKKKQEKSRFDSTHTGKQIYRIASRKSTKK